MEGTLKPRYDQAPENFSDSGRRAVHVGAGPAPATSRPENKGQTQLHTSTGQKGAKGDDRPVVDNVTRGAGSTVESLYSCYSWTDLGQYLRKEDGRNYNSLNRKYCFPADDPEWTRIEKAHMALHIAAGALYPCAQVVRDILKPEPGVTKEVLDLGCGSGLWAMEMLKEFPHIDITGVDLVPPPLDPEQLPDNFRVEIDDINLGLAHFYGKFDVVHMRDVYLGIIDFQKTVQEIHKCLKPGGIALVLLPELENLDETRTTYIPIASDDNPDGSWYQRLVHEVKIAISLSGSDQAGCPELLDKGFWDDSAILDPNTCGTSSIYIPSGPWATSPNRDRHDRLQFSGALMRQSLISSSHSCKYLLKKCGISVDLLLQWMNLAAEELRTNKFKSWQRMRVAWGRRRAGPGLPAPPLSVPDIYIPFHLQPQAGASTSNADADANANPTTTKANTAGGTNTPAAVKPTEADRNVANQSPEAGFKPYVPQPSQKELYQTEVYTSKEESLEVVRNRVALRGPIPTPLVTHPFMHLLPTPAS